MMRSKSFLGLASLACGWIICVFYIVDIHAGTIINKTTSSPSLVTTLQLQMPVIPTTPNRPKTLPAPPTPKRPKTLAAPSTPKRPKTLAVPSTPSRPQILTVLSTPKRPQSNQTVVPTTQKPLQTKPPTRKPVCKDYNSKCRRWSMFGYCYNGYVRGYMRFICKKSCNFCGHMSGRCRDNHYYCPSWAWFGACEKNFAFMRLNCRHSCHVC